MQKIHKNITIDNDLSIIWFHTNNKTHQSVPPLILLVPIFTGYFKLLSYKIRIDYKGKFNLKKISSISECELNFSQKSITMQSLGRKIVLDNNNILQFSEDAGFKSVIDFWAFYEEMYRDIIQKDDNFCVQFLVIYSV